MTQRELYLKNNLEGMTDDGRIQFVFQKLLENLKHGKSAIEIGNIEQKVININKAIEIVTFLLSILNMEGGEIAGRLKSIYLYAIDRLAKANMTNDGKIMVEMDNIFTNLCNSWSEKMQKDKKEFNKSANITSSSLTKDPEFGQNSEKINERLELYG